MAPSPLHGLNIVHTESANDQYADNAQDPLLANAHFPDLAAQLDLWSNLTFQTDEPPPASAHRKPSAVDDEQATSVGDDDKDDDAAEVEGPAPLEAHVNAVNPTAVPNHHPNYDMSAFLSGFGIDPFMLPQLAPPQPQPPAPAPHPHPQAATLAQLLAAYPFAAAPFLPNAQGVPGVSPSALSPPASTQQTSQASPNSETSTQSNKRVSRPRKASSPSVSSPNAEGGEQPGESGSQASQGLSAAEDKRRRNTAASARFRLKKKEREAALERRAQELEQRVNTLERECEGLRRENGWLKGLVVGVTGASQGAQVVPQSQSNGNSSTTTKRKRGIEDTTGNAKEEKETKKAVVSSS